MPWITYEYTDAEQAESLKWRKRHLSNRIRLLQARFRRFNRPIRLKGYKTPIRNPHSWPSMPDWEITEEYDRDH